MNLPYPIIIEEELVNRIISVMFIYIKIFSRIKIYIISNRFISWTSRVISMYQEYVFFFQNLLQ